MGKNKSMDRKKIKVLIQKIEDCLSHEVSNFPFLPGYKYGYRKVDIVEETERTVLYDNGDKLVRVPKKYQKFIIPSKLNSFKIFWSKLWELGIAYNLALLEEEEDEGY